MSALFFGSISTLADTSELQRQSFNDAFAAHGLDWQWDRDDYVAMLEGNGGQERVRAYAESRGEDVDAAAVHATKSEIFQRELSAHPVQARPGVKETLEAAKRDGVKVGLVTTTAQANVTALIDSLRPTVDLSVLDVVVDSSRVQESKPDKAAYAYALDVIGEKAEDCVAIEDNVGGVQSAAAAGVSVVAFPNANTAGHTFDQAAARVESLDYAELRTLAAGA